ncbi:MAG: hypothetical protein AVDCRST_MAG68-3410 [uncultured Gemmatimonadetes bacterium]|uniref:DUF4007 domain-containing protein n=1 Tax=uncultured Gemmatimonadota bacterium TaxID=203437 RepID=A0A6J4LMT9_9BACT|nr:MAG: hypothetical protein AVDCRST_MAG68-3410 [uncultured Gemmatimonadota bacterium]
MVDGTQIELRVGGAPFAPDPLPAGPAFARHDTFHPRHGWLKKAYELSLQTPDLFTRADAALHLGVGKNMVRAIRYWAYAFGVLELGADQAGHPVSVRTEFGQRLLDEQSGLDPYLEDTASLWLLHWRLVNRPELATAWHYTFFRFARAEFSARHLSVALQEYVGQQWPDTRYADSSYEKDASCILRMYGVQDDAGGAGEDTIQCPFAELGLLRPGAEPGTFAFAVGPKAALPARVVAATALEYAARGAGARTIALPRLVHDLGSPGMAFRLSESALYAALESVAAEEPALSVAEAAGVVQLAFEGDPLPLAERLWTEHYPTRAAAVTGAAA